MKKIFSPTMLLTIVGIQTGILLFIAYRNIDIDWPYFMHFVGIYMLQVFGVLLYILFRGIFRILKAPKASQKKLIKIFFIVTILDIIVYLFSVATIKKVDFNLVKMIVSPLSKGFFITLTIACMDKSIYQFIWDKESS